MQFRLHGRLARRPHERHAALAAHLGEEFEQLATKRFEQTRREAARRVVVRAPNQLLQDRAAAFGDSIDLPFDVTHYPTHTRAQRAQYLLHAFVLD